MGIRGGDRWTGRRCWGCIWGGFSLWFEPHNPQTISGVWIWLFPLVSVHELQCWDTGDFCQHTNTFCSFMMSPSPTVTADDALHSQRSYRRGCRRALCATGSCTHETQSPSCHEHVHWWRRVKDKMLHMWPLYNAGLSWQAFMHT